MNYKQKKDERVYFSKIKIAFCLGFQELNPLNETFSYIFQQFSCKNVSKRM